MSVELHVGDVTPHRGGVAGRDGGHGHRRLRRRGRGIFIDDPKGLFIFLWYKEVKADGSPVSGKRYQNPQCAFYQLTLDNDGDPFVYTSNVQLISKVFLNKNSNLSRCYSLNKKDRKMVEEGMKKMVEPEAGGR